MSDIVIIYWWSDGCWCYDDEYSSAEYSHKSDDFSVLTMPADLTAEEINYEIDKRCS